MDYLNWKLGVQVLVKGLHLIEAGQIYLLELTSKMNSGRLTSNQTKIKSISGTGILLIYLAFLLYMNLGQMAKLK